MLRSPMLLSISLLLGLPSLAGCKNDVKSKAQEVTKPAEVTPNEPPRVEDQSPVKPDVVLIDQTLHALADATLAKAVQEGFTGGLPPLWDGSGLDCGDDEVVTATLKHIGFDPTPLKTGKSFPFTDVCVGWRPNIKPYTEMFWMISAGVIDEGTGLMPHRRCIRVHNDENGYDKAEVIDGLCLSLHLKEREAAIAGDKAEQEATAAEKTPVP